jgi:hypothetical protein
VAFPYLRSSCKNNACIIDGKEIKWLILEASDGIIFLPDFREVNLFVKKSSGDRHTPT